MNTKTTDIADESKVVALKKIPAVDCNLLRNYGDGSGFLSLWHYAHKTHTFKDLCRPGYFDEATKDMNLRAGDEIRFVCAPSEPVAGGTRPSDMVRGVIVIEIAPGKGALPTQKTIVAARRDPKLTVFAHAGEPLDETEDPKTTAQRKGA